MLGDERRTTFTSNFRAKCIIERDHLILADLVYSSIHTSCSPRVEYAVSFFFIASSKFRLQTLRSSSGRETCRGRDGKIT